MACEKQAIFKYVCMSKHNLSEQNPLNDLNNIMSLISGREMKYFICSHYQQCFQEYQYKKVTFTATVEVDQGCQDEVQEHNHPLQNKSVSFLISHQSTISYYFILAPQRTHLCSF